MNDCIGRLARSHGRGILGIYMISHLAVCRSCSPFHGLPTAIPPLIVHHPGYKHGRKGRVKENETFKKRMVLSSHHARDPFAVVKFPHPFPSLIRRPPCKEKALSPGLSTPSIQPNHQNSTTTTKNSSPNAHCLKTRLDVWRFSYWGQDCVYD
jgi:hypothetical protein